MRSRVHTARATPAAVLLTAAAAAAAAASILTAGCATAPKAEAPPPRRAVFVPPPPAPPRLQFLTSFDKPDLWAAKGGRPKGSFADFVAGDVKSDDPGAGRFGNPYGVAARDGVVYVCDVGIDRVHVLDLPNKQYRTLQAPMKIENPVNMAIDKDGTRYVVDSGRRTILVFDAQEKYLREIGSPQDCTPIDVAISGDELFVADVVGGEVEVWNKRGELQRTIASKGDTPETLGEPTNIDVSGDLLFVTDTRQQAVKVFGTDGTFVNMIGQAGATLGNFGRPKGIAVDADQHVYVADAQFDAIQVFRPDGQLLLKFGAPGDLPESVVMPAGLAIDATSIDAFREYLDPSFEPEYLLFEANQYGVYRLAVYAFGRSRDVAPEAYEVKEVTPAPSTTQPATQPAGAGMAAGQAAP